MEHFFLPSIPGDRFTVEGETYRHLTRARRMAVGDRVVFCDGRGWDYLARMTGCTREGAAFLIESRTPAQAECAVSFHLYQCLPKGDKMEEVLRRCTPLGVSRFIPVLSARCVAGAPGEAKRARWEKIVRAAATQSGRSVLPEISDLCTFEQAAAEMRRADAFFLCYENATAPLPALPERGTIAFLIGPEGGLTPQEADLLPCCSLGKRILRCEEAAAILMPILLDRTGNL